MCCVGECLFHLQVYHKKRVEKEKEVKKKSEELSKQTAKLKKMLGLVPPRGVRGVRGAESSKRNLITSMEEVTNNDKKPRVEVPNDDKKLTVGSHRRLRRRKAKTKQGVRVCDEGGQSSLHHLLLAAGLQVGIDTHTHTHTHTPTHTHTHSRVMLMQGLHTTTSVRSRCVVIVISYCTLYSLTDHPPF